jgi:transcriptional regulator with XRE-family HTH domain
MSNIHKQLKERRKALGLKQEDMILRVGMARQQYQRLESNGNPRLETLELVAKGLKMELLLIPQEKLRAVKGILDGSSSYEPSTAHKKPEKTISDDPWEGLLED